MHYYRKLLEGILKTPLEAVGLVAWEEEGQQYGRALLQEHTDHSLN